jgi:transcriptional regulator with XRE-family HTH domain
MDIKELRASTGMTQKTFSEYFNIPVRTIQDWERKRRTPPDYVTELIKYKIYKEELVMKKGIEALNRAKEIMEGVYVQDLPELRVGDVVKLGEVWDGNGDVPEDSCSWQIAETEWINFEFEIVEQNEDAIETLVRITDINLI